MDLFSLVARLTLDKSQYEQGLNDAASDASGFGSKLKMGLGTAAKLGTVALSAFGGAAVAGTKALIKGAGEVAAYGDNIDKMSQKLGISAKAYQEWDAILQHSGTSIDSMGIGMKTLATQAAKGSDAFTKLGISQKKAASMSREDLFAETITALQNVADENERAQLAQELFGRSAMELGPLLNTSAAETEAMRQKVHELGGVMSDDAVKAAAHYQDSLQDMQTAFTGLKNNLIGQFMPSLSTVMEGITDLFSGKGTEKIKQGINEFMDKLGEIIPDMLELATDIIVALAEGVVDALPELIEKAPVIIEKLVSALIDLLPKILEAGGKLIVSLGEGIISALGDLGEYLAQVGDMIVGFFSDIANSAIEWGKDLINNFVDGIKSMWNKAKNAVSDFAGMVKDFLGFSEPEEGPLSNFHTYAPDMMKLFAEGIEQNKGMIADAIDGAFAFGPSITGNMAGQGETYKVSRGGENGGRNIVIPIMIDGREFARAEVPYIEAEQNRVGIRLSGGYA